MRCRRDSELTKQAPTLEQAGAATKGPSMIAPFLKETYQAWKPIVGWSIIALGLLTMLGVVRGWFARSPDDVLALVIVGANIATVGACVWMCRSIQCPTCRFRLFWHAIRGKTHPSGLEWFWSFTECPNCRAQPNEGGLETRQGDGSVRLGGPKRGW